MQTYMKGITYLELILSILILIFVLSGIAPFFRATHKSWEEDEALLRILNNARAAMDRMCNELKYTNAIIAIDPNYVKFGTYGEEIYLDDRNAGHSSIGSWQNGEKEGGFAADYLKTTDTGARAIYKLNIITEGVYEIYVYYIADPANTDSATYSIYDDNVNEQNFTIDQRTKTSKWVKIGSNNFTSFGNDRIEVASSTGNYLIADGIKLVYIGYDHKEFNFVENDPTPTPYDESHKIFFRAASMSNSQASLLVDNVYKINPNTPIFSYYQADGQTPATTPDEVALIKICFELHEPEGKVNPYRLCSSAHRLVTNPKRMIVINEINPNLPGEIIAFDNFDGSVGGMDGKNYGWLTDPEYGWLSVNDNLEDQDTAGWLYGGRGNYYAYDDAGNWVIYASRDLVNNTDIRSRFYFYEQSVNYTLTAKFKIVNAGTGSNDPYFGFYLRFVDRDNYIKVDTLSAQTLRIFKREAADDYILAQVGLPAPLTLNTWYTIRIDDIYGKIRVLIDDVEYIQWTNYNSSGQTTTIPVGTKGIFAFSDCVIYFDDIKIISYDFKPIAYQQDFEADCATCDNWLNWSATGTIVDPPWQRGIPTSGPGQDVTINGNRCLATNLSGDYVNGANDNNYSRQIYIGNLWSFPALYYWQSLYLPNLGVDDDDAFQSAVCKTTAYYWQDEEKVYPQDPNAASYPAHPNAMNNKSSTVFDGGVHDAWTETYSTWTQIRVDIRDDDGTDIFGIDNATVDMYFASNNDATVNLGVYIDDIELYPTGIWMRGPKNDPAEPTPFSGNTYWGTLLREYDINNQGLYPNFAHAVLETPAVRIPDRSPGVVLSWYQWLDTEGLDYDGALVLWSSDNGRSWIQFTNTDIKVGYNYDAQINVNYGNELGGYYAWTVDHKTWTNIQAELLDKTLAGKVMKFRFVFSSDSSLKALGWYIDNVIVFAPDSPLYNYIELYNPTPYYVNVSDWRIKTETSYGDVTPDLIEPDIDNGNDLPYPECTTIAPYSYAIVTARETMLYDTEDALLYDLPPNSQYALRLRINDNRFGYSGLKSKFGQIWLYNEEDKLIDYVGYNLGFYDDMENTNPDYPYSVWSTNYFAGQTTEFVVADPTSSSGPILDRTKGLYDIDGGKCWLLKNEAGVYEAYSPDANCDVRTPAISLLDVPAEAEPSLVFYYWTRLEGNNDDGFYIQASTTGGSNFTDANTTEKLTNVELNPDYDGNIDNPAKTPGYYIDRFFWREVTADLTGYTNRVIMLRFYFGADPDGQAGGVFLDDIAVCFDWRGVVWNYGAGWRRSIERRIWKGASHLYKNWAASLIDWGTPNRKNSVTP